MFYSLDSAVILVQDDLLQQLRVLDQSVNGQPLKRNSYVLMPLVDDNFTQTRELYKLVHYGGFVRNFVVTELVRAEFVQIA